MGASGSKSDPKSDPTKAEIDASAITDALAALNMGALDANAAERACRRVQAVCLGSDNPQQRICDAGALEACVAAMRTHAQAAGVQEQGCAALRRLSIGTDAKKPARKQRAAEAGALEAVVAGALEGNGRLDLGGGMVLRCQDGHLTVERSS